MAYLCRVFFSPLLLSLLGTSFGSKAICQQSPEGELARTLGIQRAQGEGFDAILRGDYSAAIDALERQLGNIRGNPEYLDLLRQSYVGYVGALRQQGKSAEMETYLRRLRILEGGLEKTIPIHGGEKGKPKGTSSGSVNVPAKLPGGEGKELPTEDVSSLGVRLSLGAPKVGVLAVAPLEKPLKQPTFPALAGKISLVRGNLDDAPRLDIHAEPNPFEWENSEENFQVRELIAKAEDTFAKKDFNSALFLYTEAWQLQPRMSQGTKDKWAYCLVSALVENANNSEEINGSSLEFNRGAARVRSLTNRFDEYLTEIAKSAAQKSSAGIQDKVAGGTQLPGGIIQVVHDPIHQAGWHVTQTVHFRVFHKLDRAFADRIARVAEQTRQIQGARWFGMSAVRWQTKCDLYIYGTGVEYSQVTGVPSSSPGHSTVKVESGIVKHRRIDLHADDPNMLLGVLPHEATHVVLAGNLGNLLVPRWADEGMAVLSEPTDRIEKHTRQVAKYNREGGLIPVRQLLDLRDYPEQDKVGVFYAQSVSVVQYLASLRGPEVFVAFLREGMAGNYDEALRRHYGLTDCLELERTWRTATLNRPADVVSR